MQIEMKNATKKYGEGEALVYALNGVDLSIDEGEICVILGPSGSGKSTLLNMLGGLDSLDSGSFVINGKEISKLKGDKLTEYRRDNIGFVFQFYNLIQDLTVRENVEVVADISANPFDVDEVLEELEINEYKNKFPREMSGGQQQRASIARAMVKNPKVLLCDELTGALDSASAKVVLRFIEKINKDYGTTIIIVTHNEIIANMAHRIVRLKDGKVIQNELNEKRNSIEEVDF